MMQSNSTTLHLLENGSSVTATSDHNYSVNANLTSDKLNANANQGDDSCQWQTVTPANSKRQSYASSSNGHSSKKIRKNDVGFSVPTNNRFDAISDTDSMDDNNATHQPSTREPKPPPIFIPDVVNISSLINSVEAVIPKDGYTYKCINQNKIKVNPLTIDAYRKLVHKLKETKVKFHTYQIKQDRSYRVVLKNIHYSTDVSDIKNALEDRGFSVRNVTNMRQYKTKQSLSMFFVDLEPNARNKDIFNLQYLLNAKISVEPPHKKTDIVQCKKCQNYGHTKTYCWHPSRCVKCGQGHDTQTCTKPNTTPPKCVHCDGTHPANYKGCVVYRELKQKSFQPNKRKTNVNQTQIIEPRDEERPIAHSPSTNARANPARTYAQVTSNDTTASNNDSNVNNSIQDFFCKFEKIMLRQAEQLSTLMNLLSTVISKLK